MAEVLIVGAGVIGLTTAIRLAEAGHAVTVRAGEIPGRTSLTAAAVWGRYLAGPDNKVRDWGDRGLAVLRNEAEVEGTGVRLATGVEASREPGLPNPVEGSVLAEPCDQLPAGFESGWRYTVPVINMPSYMDYLMRRFDRAGGVIRRGVVDTLEDLLKTADAVVNCTGIDASHLVDDAELVPMRGQLVLMRNPGLTEFFIEEPVDSSLFVFWLPHGDLIIVGGQVLPGSDDLEVDLDIAREMVARCAEIEPSLADAEIVSHRVALRPGRPEVRLEYDGNGVIHNYGHGGAGVSIAWGCAHDVLHLIGPASG